MFTTDELYSNAYHRVEEGGTTVSHRSGLLTLTETVKKGAVKTISWCANGFAAHTTTRPELPKFKDEDYRTSNVAFSFSADGMELRANWILDGVTHEQQDKGVLTTVALHHELRPVTVKVKTYADGTCVLKRWLEITNTGSACAAVSDIAVMSTPVGTTNDWRRRTGNKPVWRLGYMENHRWKAEGEFRWHDVRNDGAFFGGRYERAIYRHPMFVLENRATGETFMGQFAYSGGYRFEFDYDDTGDNACLSFRALITGGAPTIVLDPGETTVTPAMHVCMMYGGLDSVVNEMNRHFRRSVRIFGDGGTTVAPQETGLGPESNMDTEQVFAMIDSAADIGSEFFFLDASWYCPKDAPISDWAVYTCDWFPENERYEKPISAIRVYAHSKGVKFGLWMEPERMGAYSRIFKEHPEYCAVGADGEMLSQYRGGGGVIDLTRPEAAAWVEEQMNKVVDYYKLDLLRIDYNIAANCIFSVNLKNGMLENGDYRYYQAWYDILRRVREKHPGLVVEGCAGGGGRTDFGQAAIVSHTWVTDCQLAPRSFSIINGMSMCLPCEMIDRLSGGQSAHTISELDFLERLMLFGRPSIGVATPLHICGPNTIQLARIKHTVDIFNRVVRPMYLTGSKIYHHTPDLGGQEPRGLGILEQTDATGDNAVLGIFALADPEERETVVKFRGLDISKQYLLTMDNSGRSAKVSGYELANRGVTVNLTGALTCEILIARAV